MKYKMQDLARAACRGEPPPVAPINRAKYFMLARLYEQYRRGKLPKPDAASLKGLVLDYERLDKPTRIALLDSFIESWGAEDLQQYTSEIKELSKLYLKETLS